MNSDPADETPSPRRPTLESSGPAAMSVGLLVNGVASYLFLAAVGRGLGATDSGQVSVLWATLYLVGAGLFLPLEQELSRGISARRARGEGYGALVHRVAIAGGTLMLAVAALIGALHSVIADAVFRGDESFVLALVYGVGAVALSFVVRGLMAGSGRYYGYATFFLVDGITKALPAIALAVAGVTSPIAYAAVVTTAALVGSLVPLTRGLQLGEPGPVPPWSPLLRSMGFLLLTSLLSAILMNSGTVAVEVLATPAEADQASVFLSGLVIARVPLFFFQAVQAIVLPKLSHFAASHDMVGFRRLLRGLLLAMGALTVVATVGSAVLGPWAVQLLFGADFVLTGRDMALLTLASMLMMCALTINQAQLALHHQHETGWPWGLGSVVFLVVTAVAGPDLLLRVELGMVAGGATVAVVAGLLLVRELRHPDADREAAVAI